MMRIAGGWRKLGHDVNFAQLAASPPVADWHAALGDAAAVPEQDQAAAVDGAEPFALAPMQHAYWIGRSDNQDLGGVAAHLYVEFEGPDLDPDRLARAGDDVVARHPMLRAQFPPDGLQRILPAPGVTPLTVLDLRETAPAEVARRLEDLREAKTHQRMRVEDGQVLDIVAVRLPGERTRACLDLDMLAAAAMSYRVLVTDLARAYLGETLAAIDDTCARYCAEHQPGGAERDRDRAWWQDRLDDLPAAPVLPGCGPQPPSSTAPCATTTGSRPATAGCRR